MEKGKYLRGSFTVEMSLLMPFVLFLILECILAIFYYHDKNILSGAAYETTVVGSNLAREKDKLNESRMEELCRQRINGKCILMTNFQVNAEVGEDVVEVSVRARHKRLKVHVTKRASLTEPEQHIRKIRKIKEVVRQ